MMRPNTDDLLDLESAPEELASGARRPPVPGLTVGDASRLPRLFPSLSILAPARVRRGRQRDPSSRTADSTSVIARPGMILDEERRQVPPGDDRRGCRQADQPGRAGARVPSGPRLGASWVASGRAVRISGPVGASAVVDVDDDRVVVRVVDAVADPVLATLGAPQLFERRPQRDPYDAQSSAERPADELPCRDGRGGRSVPVSARRAPSARTMVYGGSFGGSAVTVLAQPPFVIQVFSREERHMLAAVSGDVNALVRPVDLVGDL